MRVPSRRSRLVVLAVMAGAVSTGALSAPAQASLGAVCQPFAAKPCLFPFPDNRLTRSDRRSATGRRVDLPAAAMPVSAKGVRVAAGPYNRNDGFSPGSTILIHVPGLDNPAALQRTGAVPLANMARAFAKQQPILVIDEATGRRALIWAQLDALATSRATTDLMIQPGRNLTEGHTYVVALRNLKTAGGRRIAPAPWFRPLARGGVLPRRERSQRRRYARIFKVLRKAGVRRAGLYAAWDFTVASTRDLTGRMLAIRNAAFAQLGDTNLGDGRVAGRAPAYSITSAAPLASTGLSGTLTAVKGTFSVPCYLVTCGPTAATGFHYSSSRPDATPTQTPGNVATAQFECIIPSEASAATPARISLYGHGLLGSHSEVEAGNVEAMATEHNMVFCATDWWGLAGPDTLNDAGALGNLNAFPNVVDRLQQGVLNTLFLGRLLLNPHGLAASPAFQSAGHPRLDTSHLYYDGNSQGGIMGGMLTAVEPDLTRSVLGVSGMNYGDILVQRSTDFSKFGAILYPAYPDVSEHPLVLDLMQQLWDRGDPDGYAEQMTNHPLPDTPAHTVLMQIAYGDFQVSDFAAATEARTIGASVYAPALDPVRSVDRNLFYGVPAIRHFPFGGSAIEVWDSGPGRVQPPPFTNTPPVAGANNIDPHPDPRSTPLARLQKSEFLAPAGAVFDVCGGSPCHAYDYTP